MASDERLAAHGPGEETHSIAGLQGVIEPGLLVIDEHQAREFGRQAQGRRHFTRRRGRRYGHGERKTAVRSWMMRSKQTKQLDVDLNG